MTLIRFANFPIDSSAVLDIWREYVASPLASLDFQANDAEFSDLPGKYARPDGGILLADGADDIDGCVAFRRVTGAICEMKRLYVRPHARGRALGHALVARLIAEARTVGYREIRLDVLAEFERARALYARFGFAPAEPVAFNPVPGTEFLGLHID